MNFDEIWAKVHQHAGEEFYELAGKRFTYSVDTDSLQPSTHEQPIPRQHFQRALESGLLTNLRELKREFGQRQHSYIFSVLTDPRIKEG
jgi:hypothetical protein